MKAIFFFKMYNIHEKVFCFNFDIFDVNRKSIDKTFDILNLSLCSRDWPLINFQIWFKLNILYFK